MSIFIIICVKKVILGEILNHHSIFIIGLIREMNVLSHSPFKGECDVKRLSYSVSPLRIFFIPACAVSSILISFTSSNPIELIQL